MATFYGSGDTTWLLWNQTYSSTTTTNTAWPADWVWQTTTTSSTTNVLWASLNWQYEETAEQRRLREARRAGYDDVAAEWDAYRAANAELGRLAAEDLRAVEDAFQRGREERIEADRQAELRRQEVAATEREREAARRRAEKLLVSLLRPEQKREWLAHRRVTEVAPSGRVWRLFPQWAGAASLMDGEVRRATLCVHPQERVPEADNMAALVMALRAGDENHLIQIAVLHGGRWTEEEQEIRRQRIRVAA